MQRMSKIMDMMCLLAPPWWHVLWSDACDATCCMYSALVDGLSVVARVGVFSWLPLCGIVGLRWGAEVTRLCVCLCYRWFPALVPACVYRPTIGLCVSSTRAGRKRQCIPRSERDASKVMEMSSNGQHDCVSAKRMHDSSLYATAEEISSIATETYRAVVKECEVTYRCRPGE